MLYCKGLSKYKSILGLNFRIKLRPKHYEKVGLIFGNNDGIANRVFGLINAVNYFTPEELYIFWADEGWVSAKFYDLFDISFKTKIKEFNDINEFNKVMQNCDLIIEKPDVSLKTLDGKSLGLKYNSIKPKIFFKYQKTFQCLKPKAELVEKINQNMPKKMFTAVQIRNNPDWEDFGRNEDLNLFASEMKKANKNEIFYLSVMNEKISNDIKSKCNNDNQIFELKNKNYQSMKDAVCDLFIMSKARNAIYSFGSTFGELAFWLSENMQNVTVAGSQKKWINKKCLERNKRIKQNLLKFIRMSHLDKKGR